MIDFTPKGLYVARACATRLSANFAAESYLRNEALSVWIEPFSIHSYVVHAVFPEHFAPIVVRQTS